MGLIGITSASPIAAVVGNCLSPQVTKTLRAAISARNEAETAFGGGLHRDDAEPEILGCTTPSQLARRAVGKRFALGALVVASLCANFYLALTNYGLRRDYAEQTRARGVLETRYESLESESNTTRDELQMQLGGERERLERCEANLTRTLGQVRVVEE